MISTRIFALTWAMFAASAALAAPPSYKIVDRIAGPDGRWDYVRVDAANNRVLVVHGTSVMSVDLATNAVTAGLVPGKLLHDALPVNGGAQYLVTDGGSGTAVFVDAKTNAVMTTVKAGVNPDAATFDPHSGLVLVMNHSGGDITLIDPKAQTAVGVIPVGGALEAAAVDGAGKAFVNVEDKNQIAVVDIAARTVTARYPLTGCDGPTGIAYDAADRMLIVACDGITAFVDAGSGTVLQTLATGKGADGVAFDAARRLAFTAAGRDGAMAVIAVRRGKSSVVQTVQTEVSARTIALDSRTGRLYLPSARLMPAASGGRPTLVPGTFRLLVISP